MGEWSLKASLRNISHEIYFEKFAYVHMFIYATNASQSVDLKLDNQT